METIHHYEVAVKWTGNLGSGTCKYNAYNRDHIISSSTKNIIEGSSDPAFRGDKTKYNPEELLVSSISACHMLWYLHLCAEAKVIVTDYTDRATGTLVETKNGSGYFIQVILNPVVCVSEFSMVHKAIALHDAVRHYCFITNSVKFPIHHRPEIRVKS